MTTPASKAPTQQRRRRPSASKGLPTVIEIEGAGRAQLLGWWKMLFDTDPPTGMSQNFLRRFIAFEVQARQSGGLTKQILTQLDRLEKVPRRKPKAGLKPGARILREWNGTTHVVEVRDDGCHWNGGAYRSLSSVARAITGARWSGPRFFGLLNDPSQARLSRTKASKMAPSSNQGVGK